LSLHSSWTLYLPGLGRFEFDTGCRVWYSRMLLISDSRRRERRRSYSQLPNILQGVATNWHNSKKQGENREFKKKYIDM